MGGVELTPGLRMTSLMTESLVFLTHATEFADLDPASHSLVVVSRVPQSLPIDRRVEIWFAALASKGHPSLAAGRAPPAARLRGLLGIAQPSPCAPDRRWPRVSR